VCHDSRAWNDQIRHDWHNSIMWSGRRVELTDKCSDAADSAHCPETLVFSHTSIDIWPRLWIPGLNPDPACDIRRHHQGMHAPMPPRAGGIGTVDSGTEETLVAIARGRRAGGAGLLRQGRRASSRQLQRARSSAIRYTLYAIHCTGPAVAPERVSRASVCLLPGSAHVDVGRRGRARVDGG
jgi:hypothetical protein